MVEKFKAFLKKDGRTIKWFYDEMVKGKKVDLTYSGFSAQLNGYAPISKAVRLEIDNYMNEI